MKLEAIRIYTKDGQTAVWAIPFRWYKTKWGKSYEPINKIKPTLSSLEGWELIKDQTTKGVIQNE